MLRTVTAKNEVSAVGDPGMQRDGLRVAFEAWNFCNEVAQEAPHMGSPRAAECFDLSTSKPIHHITHISQYPFCFGFKSVSFFVCWVES